jgi:hypothetical protein
MRSQLTLQDSSLVAVVPSMGVPCVVAGACSEGVARRSCSGLGAWTVSTEQWRTGRRAWTGSSGRRSCRLQRTQEQNAGRTGRWEQWRTEAGRSHAGADLRSPDGEQWRNGVDQWNTGRGRGAEQWPVGGGRTGSRVVDPGATSRTQDSGATSRRRASSSSL